MKKSILVGLLSLSVLPATAFAQAIPTSGNIYTNNGNCSTNGYSGSSTTYVDCAVNETQSGVTFTGTYSYQCEATGLPSAVSCTQIAGNLTGTDGVTTTSGSCTSAADCGDQGEIIIFNPNAYDY